MPDRTELIKKLLRLAAPSSGTTEAERASAALEAARLIAEDNVQIGSTPTSKPVPPTPPQPRSSGPLYNVWVLSVASRHCGCSVCGKLISADDTVWVRVNAKLEREYKHRHGACGENAHDPSKCQPIPTNAATPRTTTNVSPPASPASAGSVRRTTHVDGGNSGLRNSVLSVSRVVCSTNGTQTRVEV